MLNFVFRIIKINECINNIKFSHDKNVDHYFFTFVHEENYNIIDFDEYTTSKLMSLKFDILKSKKIVICSIKTLIILDIKINLL